MDYVEKARALRADPAVHYNCCQAVLVTFADRLGLTPEQANALGAHFWVRDASRLHLRRGERRSDGAGPAGLR